MKCHAVGFGGLVKQKASGDNAARDKWPQHLKETAFPVDWQRNRPEEDDEACQPATQAISHNQRHGAPAADLVTLLVPEILDLDGREGVESEEGAPLVADAGHGRGLHGSHAGGAELAGRVEEGVDDVLSPPGAGADVVVDPGLHHECQRLGEAAEQEASRQKHAGGNDIPLLSGFDGEAARRDRAPGLVKLVFLDGTWILLVAKVEVEDIQPDVGQRPGEGCGDIVPARRVAGDSSGC